MAAPEIPSTPSLAFAQVKLLGSKSALIALQSAVDHLSQKARLRQPFFENEKEFLVELFECFSLGGRITGFGEAAQLARHYVEGKGKTLRIDHEVYAESVIVQEVQAVMKLQIEIDLKSAKGAVALSSADLRLKKRPELLPLASKSRNVNTQGRLLDEGWLLAEQNNQRLQKANNRFQLTSVSQRGSSLISTTWRVDDEYVFEGFKKGFVTNIVIRENMILRVPDGLSAYMVDLGVAKPFKHFAEWKDEWRPAVKPAQEARKRPQVGAGAHAP